MPAAKSIFLPSANEFQIIWENPFEKDKGNDCLTTCDGTDFQIAEQGKAIYGHKFKKSGLQYEVCLCILTGDIVWVTGLWALKAHTQWR